MEEIKKEKAQIGKDPEDLTDSDLEGVVAYDDTIKKLS
jgi:hypothetical protein